MHSFCCYWCPGRKILCSQYVYLQEAVFHCKARTYIILLNRQRMHQGALNDLQVSRDTTLHQQTVNHSCSNSSSPAPSPIAYIHGRAIVITSSKDILSAFWFLHQKNPSALN